MQKASALLTACEKGDAQQVTELLKTSIQDLNTPDRRGQTPLAAASEKGRTEVVRILLGAPAIDVNAAHKIKGTPLMQALTQGHEDVAIVLLSHPNVDPNLGRKHGLTPLSEAASAGMEKVVEAFLTHPKTNIAQVGKEDKWTAFMHATNKGCPKVVALFLKHAQKIRDVADKKGWDALAVAVIAGHEEVMNMMIDAGADHRRKDKNAWTLLIQAILNARTHLIPRLLSLPGVDLSSRGLIAGFHPFAHACHLGNDAALKMLWDHHQAHLDKYKTEPGQPPLYEQPDHQGHTPLGLATVGGHVKCMKFMLDIGASMDITNNDGHSVIMLAAWCCQKDALKLLLEYGANLNIPSTTRKPLRGWNVFTAVVITGHLSTLRFLMDLKDIDVKINFRDVDGQTPIHLAGWSLISHTHMETTRMLLRDPRVEWDTVDYEGKSTLHSCLMMRIEVESGFHVFNVTSIHLRHKSRVDHPRRIRAYRYWQRRKPRPTAFMLQWFNSEFSPVSS